MNTVFIGGSRHVSRLPPLAKERLDNVVGNQFSIVIGDANGADKAVQQYLSDLHYEKVTVFCSGEICRNNLGHWETNKVHPSKTAKGFQFYAAKDREMAVTADFGLMIWDGKSAGTLLNVLRLLRAKKKTVLVNVPDKIATTFKDEMDWLSFLQACSPSLRSDLRERATPEEWGSDLFSSAPPAKHKQSQPLEELIPKLDEEVMEEINAALYSGDPKGAVELLGQIAKAHGMSQLANETGFAREALYRAFSSGGNPEFATVLKVINSIGFRLTVDKLGR